MKRWLSQGSVDALPALHRYARSLAGEAEADDLVHDALVRAYDAADRFRPGEDLNSWLLRILHNLFVSGWRRQQTVSRSAQDLRVLSPSAVPANQEQAARLRQVSEAFQQLPAEQRAAMHLVVVEGLSYQEAARVLDVPIGTVMSRLSRARARLRQPLPARRAVSLTLIKGGEADG